MNLGHQETISLLYGIPKYLIQQLQLCQNTAARIIPRMRKFDHITPILVDLHWLPVMYKIKYKIMLITYKALHGLAPPCISVFTVPEVQRRSLRSGSEHRLQVPPNIPRLETFGARAYEMSAPILWNSLPRDLRDPELTLEAFKTKLKTPYFNQAYFL